MAAGQGFKTFATGDVLSAADVNGYLMQGVLVFATAAARDAAITAPAQGQTAYLKSDNLIYTYNGSAWTNSVGDITAVTTASNSGLAGGATAGAVALTLNTAAKGDLLAGTGSGTAAVLTVGTNGQTLVADSTAATGLKWGSPSQIGVYANLSGGSQATVAGTPKIIAFATEQWDTNSFHDNTTNNSRITIPTGYGGYYLFVGNINVATSDAAALMIYKNGTSVSAGIEGGEISRITNTGGNTFSITGSVILNAAAGDYFELAAKIFTAAKTVNNAAFQAVYLGA